MYGRSPIQLVRVLRGRSPGFIARRALREAQAPLLRARVHRWRTRITPTRLDALLGARDLESALDHVRSVSLQRWLHVPEANGALTAALIANDPGFEEDARRRAQAAAQGEIDLLGSGRHKLDEPIDWLTDFTSGTRWQPHFSRGIDTSQFGRPSDVKIPWELSRGHQLVDLARGHLVDPDGGYAKCAVALLRSWIEANPVGWTVNWACTMDVAIRVVNWLWCLSTIVDEVGDDDLAVITASLLQHGEYIAATLERSDINGNHYISDAVGLIALGTVFADTSRGQRWVRIGGRILLTELALQILPDGVDHEASVSYHRLVAEIFLTGMILLRSGGVAIPEMAWRRLQSMAEYTAAYTRPDGSIPLIGDTDDGRLQRFGSRRLRDHRHWLSTAALLFDDPVVTDAAGACAEDSFWLLGADAGQRYKQLHRRADTRRAIAFWDGGMAVLRGKGVHVVMDAGPVGLRGRGGHGHNDALHVDVWFDGDLIIDPGSYVYTADIPARNRFRSSLAHNGPVLDGREIAELGIGWDIWRIADTAMATLRDVLTDSSAATAEGEHHGYRRLGVLEPVRRRVRVEDSRVEIRDEVPKGAWSTTFVLAPSVTVVPQPDTGDVILCRDRRSPIRLHVTAVDARLEVVPAEASSSYGVLQESKAVRVVWEGGIMETELLRMPEPPEPMLSAATAEAGAK